MGGSFSPCEHFQGIPKKDDCDFAAFQPESIQPGYPAWVSSRRDLKHINTAVYLKRQL